jgi:cellobiose phosphorylase
MALFHADPNVARQHILEAARHQFADGDVLHWWHPPDDVGLRSRCSDNLLWLPLVTAEYLEATGVRRTAGGIRIDPRLPTHWPEASIFVRDGDATHQIRIVRGGPGQGPVSGRVDGETTALPVLLPLRDGVDHLVEVTVGAGPEFSAGQG